MRTKATAIHAQLRFWRAARMHRVMVSDADRQEQYGGEFREEREGESDAEEDGAAEGSVFEPERVGEEGGGDSGADRHIHGGDSGVGEDGRQVGEDEDGRERAPIAEEAASPQPDDGAGQDEEGEDADARQGECVA